MGAILMQSLLPYAWIPFVTFLLGIALAAMIGQIIARAKAKILEQDLQRQIEGAKREAENIIKSAQIDAAAEAINKREEVTSEANAEVQSDCLLLQPFIKDPTKTIQDIITETIAKIGENITVKRFARFQLGES